MVELSTHQEGSVRIMASSGKISSEMDVFYNPVMKFNRDCTIAVLNALHKGERSVHAVDLMAGSGVRALRLLKECPCIEQVIANDVSSQAIDAIRQNAQHNGLDNDERLVIKQKDALRLLGEISASDYIDVDPFGSPNRYLPMAVERTKQRGVLAVTATDTSCLAGTYPATCKRKYWAVPMHNELMHEVALRIMVRKVQLLGASLEMAFAPLYVYAADHYVRLFFQAFRGKGRCDALLSKHEYLHFCDVCAKRLHGDAAAPLCCNKSMRTAGPMWCGPLWDGKIAVSVDETVRNSVTKGIAAEAAVDVVGFYDLHHMTQRLKRQIPRRIDLMACLVKEGYLASITHLEGHAIRTDCPHERFVQIFRDMP